MKHTDCRTIMKHTNLQSPYFFCYRSSLTYQIKQPDTSGRYATTFSVLHDRAPQSITVTVFQKIVQQRPPLNRPITSPTSAPLKKTKRPADLEIPFDFEKILAGTYVLHTHTSYFHIFLSSFYALRECLLLYLYRSDFFKTL